MSDVLWILAIADDSKYLVTASADNTCRLWDVQSGKELAVIKHKYVNLPFDAIFRPMRGYWTRD